MNEVHSLMGQGYEGGGDKQPLLVGVFMQGRAVYRKVSLCTEEKKRKGERGYTTELSRTQIVLLLLGTRKKI